jgi:hypothetical protein
MLVAAVLPMVLVMAFAPAGSDKAAGHLATDPTALSAAAMSGSLTDAVLQKVFDGEAPNFPGATR